MNSSSSRATEAKSGLPSERHPVIPETDGDGAANSRWMGYDLSTSAPGKNLFHFPRFPCKVPSSSAAGLIVIGQRQAGPVQDTLSYILNFAYREHTLYASFWQGWMNFGRSFVSPPPRRSRPRSFYLVCKST